MQPAPAQRRCPELVRQGDDRILSDQTIIRRSDCASSSITLDARATSDLSLGAVACGGSSFITCCNRVRSATPRTEVLLSPLFLRPDAHPQDEERPSNRSCRAMCLSLPHSH